jgi:hypothetical protein
MPPPVKTIPAAEETFLAFVIWFRVLTCMFVILAVFYLFTWLTGCSVNPGISCGARKLARTPRVTKKKLRNCKQPARYLMNLFLNDYKFELLHIYTLKTYIIINFKVYKIN